MQKEKLTKLMIVPNSDQIKPFDLDSPEIPRWKQDVNQIVADLTVYRIKHRISQDELARRINTTQSVIARFERMGRVPTIEFLYKVAEGLGTELKPLRIHQHTPKILPNNLTKPIHGHQVHKAGTS